MVVQVLLRIPTILLSAWGATLSFQAITRLRQWESASETAAQYNQKAADQLFATRTTQGAAAVAIVLSLGASFYGLTASASTTWLNIFTAIATSGAWYHFSPFWYSQMQVPGVTTWNEACQISNNLKFVLLGLAGAWWTTSLVGLFLG